MTGDPLRGGPARTTRGENTRVIGPDVSGIAALAQTLTINVEMGQAEHEIA